MIKGVDTSHYKAQFDWNKAVKNDISFMMTKATEGSDIIDPTAEMLVNGAKAAGIKCRGLYHFFHANEPTMKQVNNFLRIAGQLKTEMPPILDLEEASQGKMSLPATREGALCWLEAIARLTKRTPIIYTNKSMIRQLRPDLRFAKYPLWLANYKDKLPDAPLPWKDITFWQFTDNGEESADTDLFLGDENDLEALCTI
jgi:lysozyme